MNKPDISHLHSISGQTKTHQRSAVNASLGLQEESLRKVGDPSPNLLVRHCLHVYSDGNPEHKGLIKSKRRITH